MQLPKIAMTPGGALCSLALPMVEIDPPHEEFAARLAGAMKRAGLTVADVAKALGVTYEMARRYHEGIAMPRQDKLKNLAALLGMSPAQLLYGMSEDAGRRAPGVLGMTPEEEQLITTYRALPAFGQKALRARAAELLEHFGKASPENPFGKGTN